MTSGTGGIESVEERTVAKRTPCRPGQRVRCPLRTLFGVMAAITEATIPLAQPVAAVLFASTWLQRALHLYRVGQLSRDALRWRRLEWEQRSGRGIHALAILWQYGVPTGWIEFRLWCECLGRGAVGGIVGGRALVPASQYAWAVYLLERAGMTVTSPLPRGHRSGVPQHDARGRLVMPQAWGVPAWQGLSLENRLWVWLFNTTFFRELTIGRIRRR